MTLLCNTMQWNTMECLTLWLVIATFAIAVVNAGYLYFLINTFRLQSKEFKNLIFNNQVDGIHRLISNHYLNILNFNLSYKNMEGYLEGFKAIEKILEVGDVFAVNNFQSTFKDWDSRKQFLLEFFEEEIILLNKIIDISKSFFKSNPEILKEIRFEYKTKSLCRFSDKLEKLENNNNTGKIFGENFSLLIKELNSLIGRFKTLQ